MENLIAGLQRDERFKTLEETLRIAKAKLQRPGSYLLDAKCTHCQFEVVVVVSWVRLGINYQVNHLRGERSPTPKMPL